jgi:hypothetical protein
MAESDHRHNKNKQKPIATTSRDVSGDDMRERTREGKKC